MLVLILLLIAGVIAALRIGQQRRERERLWNSLDGEPSLPAWNEESLGVSAVRVHETQEGGGIGLAPVDRATCLECHHEEGAPQSCLNCHDYHVHELAEETR